MSKGNDWLDDKEFINSIEFEDKYYLTMLFVKIHNYLKNVPVPIVSSYIISNNTICFIIGVEKTFIKVNTTIHYDDFIYLIEEWAIQFYPTFDREYEDDEQYSDEYILKMVSDKGMNLNDALELRKTTLKKESYIIYRIYMAQDKMLVKKNDQYHVYISGKDLSTVEDSFPLSAFLKKFRKLTDNQEKCDFFLSNVTYKGLGDYKPEKVIIRTDLKMYNAILIRLKALNTFSFTYKKQRERDKASIWEWGGYFFPIENRILEQDIIEYLVKNNVQVINATN